MNVRIENYECNHLCTVPQLPMVDKSMMKIGDLKGVLRWGTCSSDLDKERDGKEVERMYSDLLIYLKQFWS